jgi:hypothetical protein
VAINREPRPRLAKGDLVIAFSIPAELPLMEEIQKDLSTDEEDDTLLEKPFNRELLAHLRGGGRALILPLNKEFLLTSRALLKLKPVPVASVSGGKPLNATFGPPLTTLSPLLDKMQSTYPVVSLWKGPQGQDFMRGIRVGDGTAFKVWDGAIGTNRFIDHAQNAQLLVNAVRVLAPRGSRIVFTVGAFGNVENMGFLQAVAGWLDAAWQQFLLLCAVIVYTLGKRLGLPQESRRKQRGSRELVDALADTMNRAQAKQLAMRTALDSADQELRIALKLPRETERQRRDDLLPTSLVKALAVLEASANDEETPDWEATRRIRKVDEELATFLGGKRLLRAQTAKMKR